MSGSVSKPSAEFWMGRRRQISAFEQVRHLEDVDDIKNKYCAS